MYDSISGWNRLAGQGIEIQTSGTVKTNGTIVNAHGGNQYVELDSDWNRHVGYDNGVKPDNGNDANPSYNSAMGQDIHLTAGTYELSFWYRPRTNTEGDNGIAYGLWGGNVASLTLGVADGQSSDITDWKHIVQTFTIGNTDNYTIAFASTGDPDKLGGFIDDVELNAVQHPGAVWLLGSGLLGLVGIGYSGDTY